MKTLNLVLISFISILIFLVLSTNVNAAVPFIFENGNPGFTALDVMGGIGTIPRNLTNETDYQGTSLTITASSGTVINPVITFDGHNNAANITLTFINGETCTFWLYQAHSGWWDEWVTIGSGLISTSKYVLTFDFVNEKLNLNFDPARFDNGEYGYVFREGWVANSGVGLYLAGGIEATAIKSITITSTNSVWVHVKTFSSTAYIDVNKQQDNDLLRQISAAVTLIISIVTGVISLIGFLLWFIVFFVTNLPILVCDLEAAIMFMATSSGKNRFDMARRFVSMNQALATGSMVLVNTMITILSAAVGAVSEFVTAGAAFLGALASGIGAFLGAIIKFI